MNIVNLLTTASARQSPCRYFRLCRWAGSLRSRAAAVLRESTAMLPVRMFSGRHEGWVSQEQSDTVQLGTSGISGYLGLARSAISVQISIANIHRQCTQVGRGRRATDLGSEEDDGDEPQLLRAARIYYGIEQEADCDRCIRCSEILWRRQTLVVFCSGGKVLRPSSGVVATISGPS